MAREADKAQKTEQAGVILERFKQNLSGERRLDGEDGEYYRKTRNKLFSSLGFAESEADELTRSWGSFNASRPNERGSKKDLKWQERYGKLLKNNLEQLIELEHRTPGAAVELFRTYGIRNFGRYQTYDLARQYGNTIRGIKREPLEVSLAAAGDWLDVLSRGTVGTISTEVMGMGMDNPVFIEAVTPIEAFKRLLIVKQKFGGDISKIGVSAHGNADSTELSQGSSITADSLAQSKTIERLITNGTVAPDFITILSACYGQKIAKEISRQTKGIVATPGRKTRGVYIEYARIKHVGHGNVQIYKNGEHVDRVGKLQKFGRKILHKSGIRLAA